MEEARFLQMFADQSDGAADSRSDCEKDRWVCRKRDFSKQRHGRRYGHSDKPVDYRPHMSGGG